MSSGPEPDDFSWIPPHLELILSPSRRGEEKNLDFKKGFAWKDLSKPEKMEICRDIAAFANSGGGRILVGFEDGSFAEDDKIPEDHGFDVTKVGDALRSWFEPVPGLNVYAYPRTGKPKCIEIVIQEFTIEPVICARGSDRICEADIFIRTEDAKTTKISRAADMRNLLTLAAMKLRATAEDIVGVGSAPQMPPFSEKRIDEFKEEARIRWLS